MLVGYEMGLLILWIAGIPVKMKPCYPQIKA